MQRLQASNRPQGGEVDETHSTTRSLSSASSTASPVSQASRDATELLFKWCRMPDVADPRMYLAGCAAIFDEYPVEVRNMIADPRSGTRLLKPYPWLHDIRDACDKAYEPIERDLLRKRASESHRLALASPAKADHQRRDEQVADYEKRVKPLIASSMQTIEPAHVERAPDGRHFDRIKADLQARKARKEQAEQSPS